MLHVVLGKRSSPRHPQPPHQKKFRRHAPRLTEPVLVSVNDLHRSVYVARAVIHKRNLLLHRLHVARDQRLGSSRTGPHAIYRPPARFHPNHVVAEIADLLLDLLGSAFAHRHAGDHRAHADDDSQHRQNAAHLVPRQRPHGQPQNVDQIHSSASLGPCDNLRSLQSSILSPRFRVPPNAAPPVFLRPALALPPNSPAGFAHPGKVPSAAQTAPRPARVSPAKSSVSALRSSVEMYP